ncbi:hypothetical protein DSECCO2_102190 [anaerobic digester metagenome]
MEKRNLIDRIFPIKYHFHQILFMQAQSNASGVETLYNWLNSGADTDRQALLQCVKEADTVPHGDGEKPDRSLYYAL